MPSPKTTKHEVHVTREVMTIKETTAAPRQATISVRVGSQVVEVPVTPEIRVYWQEQFTRKNPTDAQKKRFTTLMNIVKAAYKKGFEDGSKGKT